MSDKKPPTKAVRADPKEGTIFIPGRDEPMDLIPPLIQKHDRDGVPYQHQMSVVEMIEAQMSHERCMKFIRDAMQAEWKCTKCYAIRPGTELTVGPALMDLMRELLTPGGKRIDWGSITEHLSKHLCCPEQTILEDGTREACRGACQPLPRPGEGL